MAELSTRSVGQPDRRSKDRQRMILRVGLLAQAGKPFFCLVRNVSSTGMQVKLYASTARPGNVVIRVADEDQIAGQIVWIKNGSAGISFDEDIDPETFLRLQQKLSPVKRRSMPRVKATSYAALLVGGRTVQAVLQDVSCMGARVMTSRLLEAGARVSIRLPDLPEIRGSVRWTEGSDSGIAFETPIPMDVMSQWLEGRLRVAT
jgi:hypothetical protein